MSFTLAEARAADAADKLRPLRDAFPSARGADLSRRQFAGAAAQSGGGADRHQVVEEEWGEELIRSWNSRDWIGAPQRVGAKIAPLIGAKPHEVIVTDSTSVNLFKLLVAAARLSDRKTLLSESGNFHTDLHIASGVADLLGLTLDIAPRAEVEARIGADTTLLLLTHVHYKTAERFDMARVTARAREAGAMTIWDLSHSAGAVPLDLNGAGAELAVGCGYKYLNGGPGAPAFLYVAEHLQERLVSPLARLDGPCRALRLHRRLRPRRRHRPLARRHPADAQPRRAGKRPRGVRRRYHGAAVDQVARDVRRLSRAYVEQRCPDLTCISPRGPEQRGSHISFRHPHAFEICQALIAADVIGDFRAPDVVRFGLTPLYLGFEDLWAGGRPDGGDHGQRKLARSEICGARQGDLDPPGGSFLLCPRNTCLLFSPEAP